MENSRRKALSENSKDFAPRQLGILNFEGCSDFVSRSGCISLRDELEFDCRVHAASLETTGQAVLMDWEKIYRGRVKKKQVSFSMCMTEKVTEVNGWSRTMKHSLSKIMRLFEYDRWNRIRRCIEGLSLRMRMLVGTIRNG